MSTLRDLAVLVAVGYAALVALMWLAQERLQFHPQTLHGTARAPEGWVLEEVRIASRDGIVLSGVLVKPSAARGPLVIYFGGNAEEVTAYAPGVAASYGNRAVLLVNYRGYGASGGKPGEAAMIADALELYDWAAKRPDIDPDRIAVHGRSLGTGVAVQVAGARPVRSVILTSPFASALEVAQEIYFWLPVGLVMRHPFDSFAHAHRVKAPALVLIGEADTLIRAHHSERLAGAWGGLVERLRFPGFGHNDIGLHPEYDSAIRAFLDRNL